uniref:uncharacterized protein LOC122583154 n=1 Tax=Erigeron canadensis TaxID=72917 RepID=UPI001CB8D34D|nr:uncharacterized protein LOC122583154 [Erigeron canadensis]
MGYWRRRGYRRLTTTTDEEVPSRRQKWSWKIRMPSKLKIKLRFKLSPKKLITSVHDAYVNMMMKIGNSRVISGGAISGSDGRISQFEMKSVTKYDEKLIIQLYNSLVMRQAQLMALDINPRITG